MELSVRRQKFVTESTIGQLYVDNVYECFTLEDKVRERVGEPVANWKIYGQTAIPIGRYKVILTMSTRFKRVLPLLVGVPGYEGVRIHSGNTIADTDGCIIVGGSVAHASEIAGGTSRPALDALMEKLEQAVKDNKEIWITVA